MVSFIMRFYHAPITSHFHPQFSCYILMLFLLLFFFPHRFCSAEICDCSCLRSWQQESVRGFCSFLLQTSKVIFIVTSYLYHGKKMNTSRISLLPARDLVRVLLKVNKNTLNKNANTQSINAKFLYRPESLYPVKSVTRPEKCLLPSRVKPENTRLAYIWFTRIDDASNENHMMKNARTSGVQGLTLLYETYGFYGSQTINSMNEAWI